MVYNCHFVPQFMGKSNPYMENINISHNQGGAVGEKILVAN